MKHVISRETKGEGIGGETRPICSCGWKGDFVGHHNSMYPTTISNQIKYHKEQQLCQTSK